MLCPLLSYFSQLFKHSADTYVLASGEKIGTASRYSVLPFDAIAGIVTDTDRTDPTLQKLSDNEIPIIEAL